MQTYREQNTLFSQLQLLETLVSIDILTPLPPNIYSSIEKFSKEFNALYPKPIGISTRKLLSFVVMHA